MAKQALGKGLGALIPAPAAGGGIVRTPPPPSPPAAVAPQPAGSNQVASGDQVQRVALEQVVPSPLQPRKEFEPEQLRELMDSIREHGIIQPLIVRRVNGKLELIAGERRFRASRELGLKEVPVITREASDRDVLEMALIENLQREGLNPIEEARAYERLSKEFQMRQEDIAQRVGKNRATVANAIRLLDLPSGVQHMLTVGQISTGHAKVLLSLKNADEQTRAADEVVKKALTVRGTEKLVAQILRPPPPPKLVPKTSAEMEAALRMVEQRLVGKFATNVIIHHGEKRGRIEIDYYGMDDLNRVLALLGVEEENFGD
ncbi:MAG: ParB/RepB/Spo0J family partition protein [Verrucomicrobiaceae bacterium]|nr:ParB/RepB/Spo0J family partition protein [Verrucomicrobiaceae bacterium]